VRQRFGRNQFLVKSRGRALRLSLCIAPAVPPATCRIRDSSASNCAPHPDRAREDHNPNYASTEAARGEPFKSRSSPKSRHPDKMRGSPARHCSRKSACPSLSRMYIVSGVALLNNKVCPFEIELARVSRSLLEARESAVARNY